MPIRSRLKVYLSRLYDRVFWLGSDPEIDPHVPFHQEPQPYHYCDDGYVRLGTVIHDDSRSDSETSTLLLDDAAYESSVSNEMESQMKLLLG